jgi:hypothetical protein
MRKKLPSALAKLPARVSFEPLDDAGQFIWANKQQKKANKRIARARR